MVGVGMGGTLAQHRFSRDAQAVISMLLPGHRQVHAAQAAAAKHGLRPMLHVCTKRHKVRSAIWRQTTLQVLTPSIEDEE